MWRHMARVVGEVRPEFVFVENSPMLTTRGGTRVIGDLTSLGYDCKWTVMGAADIGANHQRDRMWIVARWRKVFSHAKHNGSGRRKQQQESIESTTDMANTENGWNVWRDRFMGTFEQEHNQTGSQANGRGKWWEAEPDVGRVVDGIPARMDRIKAIGNGQVPLCAATAWRILSGD